MASNVTFVPHEHIKSFGSVAVQFPVVGSTGTLTKPVELQLHDTCASSQVVLAFPVTVKPVGIGGDPFCVTDVIVMYDTVRGPSTRCVYALSLNTISVFTDAIDA